ncbi:hypothetical protein [Streptomyces violaceusniger]|uniref:hypothetical protein n=1 Tax=Streptomyces violaceusniger TaxID=68280 RepID=UPI003802D2EC
MTETTTEAVAAPQAAPAPPVEKPPEPTPTPAAPGVEHTPGGWPVVPLALTGTNTTIGAVASAGLAGGPVGAAAAAVGALLVGGIAVTCASRKDKANAPRSTSRTNAPVKPGGRGHRPGSAGRIPTLGRGGGRGGSASGTRGGRGRSKSPAGQGRSVAASSGAGALRKTPASGSGRSHSGGAAARSGFGAGSRGAGRVGQVRALRQAQREQAPSRGAARRETMQARRDVADARRAAKAAARTSNAGTRGAFGRSAARGAGWAGRARDTAVNRARAARDRRTQDRLDSARDAVRKAPARRRARSALWRSAARMHGRRLLAAALAAPLGVLGMLTTPLGRKLGWQWLQHPGRRLYRHLAHSAREARAERDEEIRRRLADEEAEADAAAETEIGDRVERPTHLIPSTTPSDLEVIDVSGFKFAEAAAEMENAARSYDPDGNMEVLAMIEGLPQAMQSIANTFRILAERSDEEFAFEKDVAAGFDDIHRTLLNTVDAADTLVPLFRSVHAQDIARHEDPRNGSEAEKKWNV